MPRLLALLAAVVLLFPAPTAAAAGDAPAPAACQIAPRPRADFADAVATVAAGPTREPWAGPTPSPPPSGRPLGQKTQAALYELMFEAIACYNANDFPRFFALHSDDYLVQRGPVTEDDIQYFTQVGSPQPEDNWMTLVWVEGVQRLADGRVGAFVTMGNLAWGDTTSVGFYLFVPAPDGGATPAAGGRAWRIDDIVCGGEMWLRMPACPAEG